MAKKAPTVVVAVIDGMADENQSVNPGLGLIFSCNASFDVVWQSKE